MEPEEKFYEPLVQKAQEYWETSLELYKLKLIDQFTSLFSSFVVHLICLILFTLFMLMMSIGIAVWMGEWMGKLYLGFLALAAVYIILVVLVHFLLRRRIKLKVSNSLISHLTK
ncbi:MAG: hypothetical protein IPM48_00710 [Saprospiraceae bacterium]|nr:hypothetical protein [Saprospiraceae bacterium]